jgi:hypothetical protein
MNGDATFSDETLTAQRFCSAPLGAIQRLGARGNDDQRHDGIHNCGRRYRSSSGGNYAAGDRWTMTNWFAVAIPRWIARAIQATSAGAMAAGAVAAGAVEAEATDAIRPAQKDRPFDLPQQTFFRFIPIYPGPVWNHLKRRFFLLHQAAALSYPWRRITEGPRAFS